MKSPYEIAKFEVGVKEKVGIEHNKRILEYHHASALKATSDEVSWCSSFVNWCYWRAGLEGTGRANARSWCKWGNKREDEPEQGDIVIFWRESPDSWKGHVGFYVEENETHILILGGNQQDSVCYSWYPKMQILDIRRGR